VPLQGILTVLREKGTSRQDFVFFADRLSTLLVEHALQFLPYFPKLVTTPIDSKVEGKAVATEVSQSEAKL